MRENRVGAVVEDSGIWRDLGARDPYLDTHHDLAGIAFPAYANGGNGHTLEAIHPDAHIDPTASIDPFSIIGAGAEIGAHTKIESSIIWANAKVTPGTQLRRCIVRTGQSASGNLQGADI